ncbi:hypothetical protein GCM10022295_52110 [Streptomyces osmaniensis]|uniref:Uncharacterized protein n=1 Tax=Streptomyces osmaniensis TaxID=593134 RepID=A0ABP6X8X4_9ACTN
MQSPQSSFCEVREEGNAVADEPEEGADESASVVLSPVCAPSDELPLHPVAKSAEAAATAAHRTKRVMSLPPSQAVRAVPRMAVRP